MNDHCRFVSGRAKRKPRILLRSSWQVVNIGDIAHTPGVLALLEQELPGVETILWASDDLTPEVDAMLHRRFPALHIVKGKLDADGQATTAGLAQALSNCDFLLHGSGPSLARTDVEAFVRHTGKPFGVFGITYAGGNAATRVLLGTAAFVFFRDSVSLRKAQAEGVTCPRMAFGPDAAFACDLRDDARAETFLRANGLEDGRFMCCIGRYRYTPYWRIGPFPFNADRHARNEAMKAHDHLPLRNAIIAVVRETPFKILLCPEDATQMAIGREMLLDPLPDAVRDRVVWRDSFWLPDEALSTYARSAGLFGNEMHSPILCIGNGVPAMVCRFAEQTSKGMMWRDIGLGDWLFDLDDPDAPSQVVSTVRQVALEPDAALRRAREARDRVRARQRQMVSTLADALNKT